MLHLTGNVFANVCLVHFGWLTHRSNRPGNLNLLPKQLKGLSAWMEVQIVLHCTLSPLSAKPERRSLQATAVRFHRTKHFHQTGMFVRFWAEVCLAACHWVGHYCWSDHRKSNLSVAWIHHRRLACRFLFGPISVNAPPVFLLFFSFLFAH